MELGGPSERKLTISVDTGQQRKGTSWVFVGFVAFVVALVLTKVCGLVAMKRKKYHNRKRCETMDRYGKLYLLLYNNDDSEATATTILSAFDNAFCKKNVVVGVYQEVTAGTDVYTYLQQTAKTKEAHAWIDHNVGIVSVDRVTSGYVWALQELFKRKIFMDTEWCFLTQPGNTFLPEWDHAMVTEYRSVQEKIAQETLGKPGAVPILTHFTDSTKQQRHGPSNQQQGSKDRYMFSHWMDNLIGEGQQYLKSGVRPNVSYFPTVRRFKGHIPIIAEQRFSQTPKHPIKILCATTHCLFCPMKILHRALTELELFQEPIASYAVDIAFSAALWMENGVFYSCTPIVQQYSKKKDLRPDGWNGKALMETLGKDYQAYFDFLGVELSTRQISGRAMMGILPEVTMDDILDKYGSMMEYDRMQRTLGVV